MNAREPHEHTRIADVVFLEVVRPGLYPQQLVSLLEVEANHERVRLGNTVRGLAGEHASADSKRDAAVHRALHDSRQRERELSHVIERYLARHGTEVRLPVAQRRVQEDFVA